MAWMFVLLATAFVALISRLGEVTHDAFHEMALFREWLATGVFPKVDVFAYTPTVTPSVHHEWGVGAILYCVTVSTGLGLTGLSILKFALTAILWFMLYKTARLRGVHPYLFVAFSLTVFPFLWVGFATIRATLFTLVCVSIQLWMQELDARGSRKWIVAWWCLLVAWLNLHAGFVVGIGLLGIHTLERIFTVWVATRSLREVWHATKHLALLPFMIATALPLNPYGWEYVPYLIEAIRMPRPLIAEWQPLWHTHDPVTTLVMFALSIVCVALALRKQQLAQWRGALGLAICAVLALQHLRHGSIYAVVWIAYVPAWLSHASLGLEIVKFFRTQRERVLLVVQMASLACGLWLMTHAFWKTTLSGDDAIGTNCYPVGAVKYLRDNQFQGNLLTPFHAGAYVSWELHPRVKVSLDGRYEVAYERHVFDEHWDFFEAHNGWQKFLDKYPHDAVLVPKPSAIAPLLSTMEANEKTCKQWRTVYEDDAYLILARHHNRLPTVDHSGKTISRGKLTAVERIERTTTRDEIE